MISRTEVAPATYRGSRWKDKIRSQFTFWLGVALLTIMALLTLGPLLWALTTSLRKPSESYNLPPQWLPLNPDFSNYSAVFNAIPYVTYLFNSAFIAISIVIGQLFTATLAAYAFARLSFPGKNFLFGIIMTTLMIPLLATIVPVYVLISRIGLADSPWALILPSAPTAFGTFLLRQYFLGISNEFEEAAVIDGASHIQVFYKIYLPLVKPGMAILAVLTFNSSWNEFFRPLIFLSSTEKFTLPLGMTTLFGNMGTGSISVVLAGVMLSLIPVLIVYIFGQRYLIEGLTMGGLKG